MLNYFRRLQWKLTLSYAFVTAGTVIILTALAIGLVVLTEAGSSDRLYDGFYWSKTGFQDNVPYLLDDPAALQAWLDRVQRDGFAQSDFQSYTVREALGYANTLITKTQPIYVLDPDLNLIAAAPPTDPSLIGKPFKARNSFNFSMESILDAALIGDKDYYAQSMPAPDGSRLVAFPLRESDTDPVSAIVIYSLRPPAMTTPANLELYWVFFMIMMIVLFLVSVPVSGLFGWLASRGLRKRLTNLSTAAQAWSTGDLSAAPRDTSGDEIGTLTRNLNHMAEQLRSLLHTQDALARVEERNRLARDLHDTVKQQTYATRMQLSAAKNLLAADPEAAAEHLESALQLNRETQQELKFIIEELRPAALQDKGLAQAVREYAERWQENSGIDVTIAISGERALPLEVEQTLYRVLQEALSNIARHAEAETVGLSLSMTPEGVTLIVADNGRGFDPNAVSPGSYGLTGMRARLSEVGGALQVTSTPTVGTTLTATVNLATENQAVKG